MDLVRLGKTSVEVSYHKNSWYIDIDNHGMLNAFSRLDGTLHSGQLFLKFSQYEQPYEL